MLKSGSAICPTLTFQRNMIDFTQPHDPAATKGRIAFVQRQYELACRNLAKAHKAGVPMMTGTDSGFAVTPYGEWHARELEIFVDDLGFTPAAALRAETQVKAGLLAGDDTTGRIEAGHPPGFHPLVRLPPSNYPHLHATCQ